MHDYDYDFLVIGSGPAGQRAAIQAAKVDQRVAVVERRDTLGGTRVNTGTIPSKTLREAVLYLSGYRERELYGSSYTVKEHITIDDLKYRSEHVIRDELDVIRSQLRRNDVEIISAEASFVDQHTVRLTRAHNGRGFRDVTAQYIIIATGTKSTTDPHIPFDGQSIFVSDDILKLEELPRTIAIIGAGVIGCEYASMFAALGVRVTLIDKAERILPFIDSEIVDSLIYHLRQNRVTLRLGEEVSGIEPVSRDRGERVQIDLKSGKKIVTEKALLCIGRTGATERLDLSTAGLSADVRGRIKVNGDYQTEVPHIFAVGDVIGFPSLASTAMEQGRLAICHALGLSHRSVPDHFPYGIFTIPEISTVGKTEDELTDDEVPYEVGKGPYREIARGQIIGDESGLLKLIFSLDDRRLLGVHIIGQGASELIHIGQAVLTFGGDIEYFVNTVFNYPTLAEAYKAAAFDGINRMAA